MGLVPRTLFHGPCSSFVHVPMSTYVVDKGNALSYSDRAADGKDPWTETMKPRMARALQQENRPLS